MQHERQRRQIDHPAGVELVPQPRILQFAAGREVLVLTHGERITWASVSAARILGREPETLRGTVLTDLFHPQDRSAIRRAIAQARFGRIDEVGGRCRTGAHDWLPVTVSLHAVGAGDSLVASIVAVGRQSASDAAARFRAHEALLVSGHSSSLLFSLDGDERISWVSPSVTRLLGWEVAELAGRQLRDLVDVSERLAFDGDDPSVIRVLAKDGSHRWMLLSQPPTWHPELGELVGELQDLDALVNGREAIRADGEMLWLAHDALVDPQVVVHASDPSADGSLEFVIDYVNESACRFLHRTRVQLAGERLFEVLPHVAKDQVRAALTRVLDRGGRWALDGLAVTDPDDHERRLQLDITVSQLDGLVCLSWRDMTDRHEQVDALVRSERLYRLLVENATDAVVHVRGDVVEWASNSLTEMLGWLPKDWIGRRYSHFAHADDDARATEVRAGIAVGASVVHRLRMRAADGSTHWVEAHTRTFVDDEGQVDGFVESFRTIDDTVAAEEELVRRASHDHLTGLLNRGEALDRLSMVSEHPRRSGHAMALLFCDVDHLKPVNDGYGHGVGDEVLRQVAERIAVHVRAGDYAARVGGDEFVVLLDGLNCLEDALAVGEKIRGAVEEPMVVQGHPIAASLSIGVALVSPGESMRELLERADRAMYAAKRTSRNCVMALECT